MKQPPTIPILANSSDYSLYIQGSKRPFSRMTFAKSYQLLNVGDSYFGGNQTSKHIISPNTGRWVEVDRYPTPQANTASLRMPKTSWDLIRQYWGMDCIFNMQTRSCGCIEHYCGVTISRFDTQPVAGCSNEGEPTTQVPVQWHKIFNFCEKGDINYISNPDARPLAIVWCDSKTCSSCCSSSANDPCNHVFAVYSTFSGGGIFSESFDGGKTWSEFMEWGIVVSAFHCFDSRFFWGSTGVNLYWSDDINDPTQNEVVVIDKTYIILDFKSSGQMIFCTWFDSSAGTYGVAVSHNSGESWEPVLDNLSEIRSWDVVGSNVAVAVDGMVVFGATDKDTVFIEGLNPFSVSIEIPDFRRSCTAILAVDEENVSYGTTNHNSNSGTINGNWTYVTRFGGSKNNDFSFVNTETLACGGLINLHRVEEDGHCTYRSTGDKCISRECEPKEECINPEFPDDAIIITCNGVPIVCGDEFVVSCPNICDPCVPETEEECLLEPECPEGLEGCVPASCDNHIVVCGDEWVVCGPVFIPDTPVYYNCDTCEVCEEPFSFPVVECDDQVVVCDFDTWVSCSRAIPNGEIELDCRPVTKPICGILDYFCKPYSISKTCPYDLDRSIVAIGVDWIVRDYRAEAPRPFVEGGVV